MLRTILLLFNILFISGCQVKGNTGSDLIYTAHVPGHATWTALMPTDGWYKLGDILDITIRFPLIVTVAGTPNLTGVIGATSKNFNYISGSGTTDLLFRYTVTSSDVDGDGIAVAGSVSLNGGTLKYTYDGVINDCITTLTVPTGIVRVDGIVPILNSVADPVAGTYLTASNLNYLLGFSEPVYATGSPNFGLVFNSGSVLAAYSAGSNTTSLTFSRVVSAADLDTDGYSTGSIFSYATGSLADIAGNLVSIAFPITNSPGVLINGSGIYITGVTVPAAATYTESQNMGFTVTFSEAVTVTGSPQMTIALTTGNVVATYLSGSGTANIVFRHTVVVTEEDLNGIVISSPLVLNGGTIKNLGATLDGALSFSSPSGAGVNVDAKNPVVTLVNKPTDGTYSSGQNLNFSLLFNETVTVSGTPFIQVVIGTNTRSFSYVSGSGTSILNFSYSVVDGEFDSDGVVMSGPISLNGGTIRDGVLRNAVLSHTPPTTTGILVDAINPVISSITAPLNATFKTGQLLNFTAVFNKVVNITGTPRFNLTIGVTTVYATYLSGSGTANILFRYTVQAGELDINGITMNSPLDLDGGSVRDILNNNSTLTYTAPITTGVLVDAVVPTILSFTPPPNATYLTGQNLDFIASFSENVTLSGTPRLLLTIGVATVYANYQSGSGTSAITFRYTVVSNDQDTNGIATNSPLGLNTGTIKDAATNDATLTFTSPNTSAILVDAVLPIITSITPPLNATYLVSQNLNFIVNFNKNITVTGTPRIAISVGAATVYANYLSGSGSSALTFTYTVLNTNYDVDGIVLTSPIELNSGTLKDSLNTNSALTYTSPVTSGIFVDALLPALSSVAAPLNGTYETTQNLDFVAAFNKPVDITGSPRIQLTVGAATVYALYLSGSGTTLITFRYTVVSNDVDMDGIASSSPVQLNAGAIKDGLLNNSALIFSAPNTSAVIVDAVLPVILSITAPANATYKTSEMMDFTASFNKTVTIVGTPRISLIVNTGGPTVYADYLSGSGTTVIIFRYTVTLGVACNNGIGMTSPLDLNSGTIKDSINQNSALTYTSPNTTAVLIDGIAPIISSVTAPINSTYKLAQNMDFTVNWSENVITTDSPRIAITIETGGPTVYATYLSGSGSTALIFRYTVAAGNGDVNGVALASTVALNSGTLKDTAGNVATPLTFTTPITTGLLVDGIAPYISSINLPANTTYLEAINVDFTVVWTENVVITGSPRIALNVGGSTLYATYFSGSGSANTVFRYSVTLGDEDLDGLAMTSPLQLNSGTIADIATNAATPLSFTLPNTSAILIDGKTPVLISITPPLNTTYKPGVNIDFTVNYHENVIVTGAPRLTLTVETTKYATYISGSGTSALIFRYTVAAANADLDLNGIAAASTIDLNLGTIKDAVNHSGGLSFTTMDLSRVYVIYSNMLMWFNFDDATTVTTSTAGCGVNNCVTSVLDKSGAGNNIVSGSSPGPVYIGSGFGTGNSAHTQHNNASSLNLPNVVNIKYYAVTMRTNSSNNLSALIGGASSLCTFDNFILDGNRHNFTTNTSLRQNVAGVSSSASMVSTPSWVVSTNYVYWFSIAATINFSGHTLANNAFDGRIAEFMAFDNSATLSTVQMDKVRDYMNVGHGAY